jgi:hypothetical protein
MGNIMATSSHSNPNQAPEEADTTLPSATPLKQAASSLPNHPSTPGAIVTTVTPGMPPAAADRLDVDIANRANALSNMQCVVDLADSVVCIADDLHERILPEIAGYNDRTMPDAQKALMRALTDDERLLRQYAHALYADAATFVIQDLKEPQHRLMALTADAAEKIRRIGVIQGPVFDSGRCAGENTAPQRRTQHAQAGLNSQDLNPSGCRCTKGVNRALLARSGNHVRQARWIEIGPVSSHDIALRTLDMMCA